MYEAVQDCVSDGAFTDHILPFTYGQLGTLEEKRKLQKMVFPEGIVIDTKNRVYLTSKVNSLFLAKSQFQRDSEGGAIKNSPSNLIRSPL